MQGFNFMPSMRIVDEAYDEVDGKRVPRLAPQGPNRAQRRAAEQEKRRQQRRGQRAFDRQLRQEIEMPTTRRGWGKDPK